MKNREVILELVTASEVTVRMFEKGSIGDIAAALTDLTKATAKVKEAMRFARQSKYPLEEINRRLTAGESTDAICRALGISVYAVHYVRRKLRQYAKAEKLREIASTPFPGGSK